MKFRRGDPRTREAGRKGGEVTAAQRRAITGPYEGTVLDMMDAAGLVGETWRPWRAFLKAAHALPMDADDVALYVEHTRRARPPSQPVSEAAQVVGRRGGKSQIAALVALHRAISFDASVLARGELALVPVIAADRQQARVVLSYIRGLLGLPEFSRYLERALKSRIELRTACNVEVFAASFRTTRGYAMPAVVADELAFWTSSDTGANPDSEILAALRPSMATIPGSLLLMLSSPYAQRGELYRAHERYYGQDDEHVLVWNASSRAMNPTLPAHVVERAFERDPASASSEYGAGLHVAFRSDVASLFASEAVRAVVVRDRRELLPQAGREYHAFADPSGGSSDSFALAVAHQEDGRAVLDLLREIRPPFSPDAVTEEFAATLRSYGLSEVVADRYALAWVVERFARHGIRVRHAEQTRSELYLSILPLINSGVCELLDVPRLVHQLVALERRTSGSGRDSVDHPRGAHDDCANAAAGALVLAAPQARTGPRGRVSPPLFRSPATIAAEVAADAERGVRRGRVSSPSRRLPGGPYGSWFIGPNGVERLPDTPVEPREPRLPQPPHRRKLP